MMAVLVLVEYLRYWDYQNSRVRRRRYRLLLLVALVLAVVLLLPWGQ